MADLNVLELAGLRRILEKYGWVVLTPEEQVNIEDTLTKMLDLLNSIAAAVSAQPQALVDSVNALAAEVGSLQAGQTLDDGKIDALTTAAANIQATLGPVPGA